MFADPRIKKCKSKQSMGESRGSISNSGAAANLISTTDAGNSLSGTKKSGSGLTAKSDHGDKKVGFFENFRRKFTRSRNEEARSQGMINHID